MCRGNIKKVKVQKREGFIQIRVTSLRFFARLVPLIIFITVGYVAELRSFAPKWKKFQWTVDVGFQMFFV